MSSLRLRFLILVLLVVSAPTAGAQESASSGIVGQVTDATRAALPGATVTVRGQVIEGFGDTRKRLMGTIDDRDGLGSVVKQNDWNHYTVIARGGTFLHIVNGQLMAVMIDDDPASSNNWSGQFAIEIEATTKVSVRNIWVKKVS